MCVPLYALRPECPNTYVEQGALIEEGQIVVQPNYTVIILDMLLLGTKMHFCIKILAFYGQHNLPKLIQSHTMLVRLIAMLESAKRPRRSELHCAH